MIICGGCAPDHMRRRRAMVELVKDTFAQGEVVAAICHAGWVLTSASEMINAPGDRGPVMERGKRGGLLTILGQVPATLPGLIPLLLITLFPAIQAKAGTFEITDEYEGLHAQCWSLGASFGRVEGLSGDLARLAGPSDGVIVLEIAQQDYMTPYTSTEYQLSLNWLNNFSITQIAYGRRWSTVPFPKVFLRPWAGMYITGNFLEDNRDIVYQEQEETDGLGFGAAAAAGMTVKITRSFALELALKADAISVFGQLEDGELFGDSFAMYGLYLRFLFAP